MKIASSVLVLLALIMALVPPVLAQEDHCDHEAQTIESLRHCLEHAYAAGHITSAGVYQTLARQLTAAQAAYDRGQVAVAASILQTFIYTVESQAGRIIEEPHATHLVQHAQEVLGGLSG